MPSAIRSGQNVIDGDPGTQEFTLDERSDPGEHGRAQNEELPWPEVGDECSDRIRNGSRIRIEVLIDGCADDHDDMLGLADHRRITRSTEGAVSDDPRQHGRCIRLIEGHGGAVDEGHRRGIDVIDDGPHAPLREGDSERQTHMAAATDYDDVE